VAFISIKTASFRNIIDGEVNVSGRDIFIVGENGQGKTNFIEALYFCSYASSFRGVKDGDMACTGEKDFSVQAGIDDSIYKNISVIFKEGKKTINLDGKKINDRKELLELIPSIVFCHEDMEFVSGPPEKRRWFFDQTHSLWDSLYLEDLRNYRKVIKNRNAVIRDGNNSGAASLLDALDPQIVQYGIRLMEKRKLMAEEFSLIFEPIYREISGIDGITIRYAPSWKGSDPEEELSALIGRREKDFSFGISLSGPHRDRYIFTRKGREFSGNASTGQRRLLALLLRAAQAKVFFKQTGKSPVLLFDDVLLELDGEKRRKFLSLMPDYSQAFYTFLPEEPYQNYRKADTLVYFMNEGKLIPQAPFSSVQEGA
jgi:DNA replication and repair protein RecF